MSPSPSLPLRALALALATFIVVGPAFAEGGLGEETELRDIVTGAWLDPPGEFWAPRRGKRAEVAAFLGGEAALAEVAPTDVRIPTFGGTALTLALRYFPVDSTAVVLGSKGYFGIESPAAGTGAGTVISPYIGVRYLLLSEQRFSLMVDVNLGPTAFLFVDPTRPESANPFEAQWAVGMEAGGGLAARYALGPWVFELRGLVGGRGGSAKELGGPTGAAGPFSALYGGLDLGVTWVYWSEGSERRDEP